MHLKTSEGLSVFELSLSVGLSTTHSGGFTLSLMILNAKQGNCEYQIIDPNNRHFFSDRPEEISMHARTLSLEDNIGHDDATDETSEMFRRSASLDLEIKTDNSSNLASSTGGWGRGCERTVCS